MSDPTPTLRERIISDYEARRGESLVTRDREHLRAALDATEASEGEVPSEPASDLHLASDAPTAPTPERVTGGLTTADEVAILEALGWDWDEDPEVPTPHDAAAELFAAVESILAARLAATETPGERRWDAAYTPAEVWDAGRTQGVIDAVKAHHPDASKGEFLSLIVTAPATDENPYEGVGDAVGILAAVEALLDDCDQVADTPEDPNMVKVWGVRKVLEPFGGEPHRWQFPEPSAETIERLMQAANGPAPTPRTTEGGERCGAAMPDYEDEKRDGPFLCTFPKGHPVPFIYAEGDCADDPIETDHGNPERGGFWSLSASAPSGTGDGQTIGQREELLNEWAAIIIAATCDLADRDPGAAAWDDLKSDLEHLLPWLTAHDTALREAEGERVLLEAADEMPSGTKSDYSIWDGETVEYTGYETAPNDRTPQMWLRIRAAAIARGGATDV